MDFFIILPNASNMFINQTTYHMYFKYYTKPPLSLSNSSLRLVRKIILWTTFPIEKIPARQDSPPAAGRGRDMFPLRRSAIIAFYHMGNPKEFPIW